MRRVLSSETISNVRIRTDAGWCLGVVQVVEDRLEMCERKSRYYLSENALRKDFQFSISMEEAYLHSKVNRGMNKWERELIKLIKIAGEGNSIDYLSELSYQLPEFEDFKAYEVRDIALYSDYFSYDDDTKLVYLN